jgi:hypothetical protein
VRLEAHYFLDVSAQAAPSQIRRSEADLSLRISISVYRDLPETTNEVANVAVRAKMERVQLGIHRRYRQHDPGGSVWGRQLEKS